MITDIIPRWISLKDASRYAHIGKHRLIELAERGIIKGIKDPDSKRKDWIFDRLTIDAYREDQMSAPTIREKALAIMDGMRI